MATAAKAATIAVEATATTAVLKVVAAAIEVTMRSKMQAQRGRIWRCGLVPRGTPLEP